MKKILMLFILFPVLLPVYGQSRSAAALDDTINNAVLQIQDNLEVRSTIIVYQFQSHNQRLSNYILAEIFDLLVNSRRFIVLDRGAQEVINAELDFQFNTSAGMISDDSLASLTRRLGAQAIITGSLDDTGDEYRFRIRVIGTETAAAVASYVGRVNKNDRRITAFSGRESSTGEKIGTGALNILFGLGSYLEGDIIGGITLTAGYAIAAGLFVIEATALDWDSPAVGVPAAIGAAAAGLTLVYGFVRPFIYNRSPQLASVIDNTQFGIVKTSDNSGFKMTYTIKY